MRVRDGYYVSVTRRPWRCVGLDLVALRYAARVNGLTGLAVTKLDVLTGIGPLQVAVRYVGPEGVRFEEFPYHQSILHKCAGDYERLPGWEEDVSDARRLEDLPPEARDYLEVVSDYVGVPIALVGVGPGRDQVIWTKAARRLEPVGA